MAGDARKASRLPIRMLPEDRDPLLAHATASERSGRAAHRYNEWMLEAASEGAQRTTLMVHWGNAGSVVPLPLADMLERASGRCARTVFLGLSSAASEG